MLSSVVSGFLRRRAPPVEQALRPRYSRRFDTFWLAALVALLSSELCAQLDDGVHEFDIPAQAADGALNQLAQQARISVLFSFDEIRVVTTNEVVGRYSVEQAIQLMLAGTELEASINEHGVLTANLREPSNSAGSGNTGGGNPLSEPDAAESVDVPATAPRDISAVDTRRLLEEIVVSARRRQESLQDTPIAMTVLTGANIAAMLIDDSRDLARFVPNLGTVNNILGGGIGDNITIRGIGTERIYPDGESGVGIYIDDVFFPRAAANVVDTVELERVEILRGPQGTLFGRNSMAGVIRYVTRKPSGEFGANVDLAIGTLARQSARGTVDFPLSEAWSGLVSFGSDRRDGYIEHENAPGSSGSRDNLTVRGKLRYQKDRLTVDLGYTDTSVRNDGPPLVILDVAVPGDARGYHPFVSGHNAASLPTGPWDPSWVSSGPYSIPGALTALDYSDMTQTVLEATVSYDFSEYLTFRSISASTDLDYSWSMDMDASALPVMVNRFSEQNRIRQQEFQLLGEHDRLQWQAGGFLYREKPHFNQWTSAQAQESGSPRIRDQYYSTDAWAVFGHASYDLDSRLSISTGIRYTREEKHLVSIFTQHADPNVEGMRASNADSWSATTALLSLEYQPSENLMVYGSISEGFRSGGINFNLNIGPVPVANRGINPFDPENATSLEVGAKFNSENGGFVVNTAIFATDLEGQQLGGVVEFPNGFIGQEVNAGKSTLRGVEFEMLASVTDALSLRGTAAWFDGTFDEVGYAGATGLISPDSEIPNAPSVSYSFGLSYAMPLSNGGTFQFGLDHSWRDETQSARNSRNQLTLDELGLTNVNISYAFPDERLTLSLAATNLADEYYFTQYRRKDIGGPFGATVAAVGRPREVRLSAGYRY